MEMVLESCLQVPEVICVDTGFREAAMLNNLSRDAAGFCTSTASQNPLPLTLTLGCC